MVHDAASMLTKYQGCWASHLTPLLRSTAEELLLGQPSLLLGWHHWFLGVHIFQCDNSTSPGCKQHAACLLLAACCC